jgi:hypothetical protein
MGCPDSYNILLTCFEHDMHVIYCICVYMLLGEALLHGVGWNIICLQWEIWMAWNILPFLFIRTTMENTVISSRHIAMSFLPQAVNRHIISALSVCRPRKINSFPRSVDYFAHNNGHRDREYHLML